MELHRSWGIGDLGGSFCGEGACLILIQSEKKWWPSDLFILSYAKKWDRLHFFGKKIQNRRFFLVGRLDIRPFQVDGLGFKLYDFDRSRHAMIAKETEDHDDKSESFPPTCWTMIQQVNRGDEAAVKEALDELCRTYWKPLHSFVCACGQSESDASDTVQDFLSKFLESRGFASAKKPKGRLRNYLLRSLRNFMIDRYRRETAEKRGGGSASVSIDEFSHDQSTELDEGFISAEEHLIRFDREWAETVMENAIAQMETSYKKRGKLDIFERLFPLFDGNELSKADREDFCDQLGKTKSFLKMEIYRFRKRLQDCLRKIILQTVDSEANVEDELHYLAKALVA